MQYVYDSTIYVCIQNNLSFNVKKLLINNSSYFFYFVFSRHVAFFFQFNAFSESNCFQGKKKQMKETFLLNIFFPFIRLNSTSNFFNLPFI